MDMEIHYIYLLQEREFIKTGEDVYKIGKTTQPLNHRLKQYPKGSMLLLQVICDNCHEIEGELIKIFKMEFLHMKSIGREYFRGDYKRMIEIILDYIFEFKKRQIKNITTFKQLREVSNISNIIITNSKKYCGYIKHNGRLWSKCKDIKAYINGNQHRSSKISVNVEMVMDDLCANYHAKHIENFFMYKLAKHEYLLLTINGYEIIDMKDETIRAIPEYVLDTAQYSIRPHECDIYYSLSQLWRDREQFPVEYEQLFILRSSPEETIVNEVFLGFCKKIMDVLRMYNTH